MLIYFIVIIDILSYILVHNSGLFSASVKLAPHPLIKKKKFSVLIASPPKSPRDLYNLRNNSIV